MKSATVRTSLDVPVDLHRRLRALAAQRGCSARKLILASLERALQDAQPTRPRRRLKLDPPLIRPAGRCIDLTNRDAYELAQLP